MSAQPPRRTQPNSSSNQRPPVRGPATPAQGPAPQPPAAARRPPPTTGRPAAAPPSRRSATPTSRRPAPPPQNNGSARVIAIGGAVLILIVVFLVTQPKSPGTPAAVSNTPASVGSSDTLPTVGAASPSTPAASGATTGTIPGEIAQTFTDRGHTTDPITYKEVPPMGGPHWNDWVNCGIYDKPLQNEQAVHSLEHGAVWITYQPNLPTAQVEILRNLVRQSGYRLLSPYTNLPHPIVATAWGYQLPLDSASDPRLAQFVLLHQQDPKGPEPGASCSGSVGTPIP
jgi:hypothetical protein